MNEPAGFVDPSKPDYVCKLRKALYGLKQAPRAWFGKLKQALLNWGFKVSVSDSSLFIFNNKQDMVYLLVYVDDILITGNNTALIKRVMDDLNKCFALKTLGSVGYFLGFEVHRDKNGIILTQSKYISDLLKKAKMLEAKSCPTPMCPSNKLARDKGNLFENPSLYRSLIGGLQYLTLSRPDIAFSVNKLSQFLQSPTDEHWKTCKRVLRYLKGTSSLGFHFKPTDRLVLEAYADADWASSLDDRRSTSGYCIYLGGNLVVWSSKKQHVVTLSSCESEYRAVAQTATEIVWLKSLLCELGVSLHNTCPIVWCDNTGAGLMTVNPVFHSRTKHIEIAVHFVREKVESKELEVRYVPTEFQIADVFTKPLTTSRFEFLKNKLNINSV